MPETMIDSNKNVSIVVSQEVEPALPQFFGEVVLVLDLWIKSGLVSEINEKVKVSRGRMGDYEVIDFTLLLLVYAISNERTLDRLFQSIAPFHPALAALWDRAKIASASALSRFLSAITQSSVSALRTLLFQDLVKNGVGLQSIGGLYDRNGSGNILFDVDGTREVARQRSLPSSKDYPPVRRRRASCKAGYTGRKRGEVVRTRTTVQQAHTHEWLATYGATGNGDLWGQLQQACQVIVDYLKAHNIDIEMGLVRLDGAYGWARGVYICNHLYHLGYLMRCSDYSLLNEIEVVKALANSQAETFHKLDTTHHYQVYDLGLIGWNYPQQPEIKLTTRLIVLCSEPPVNGKKPSVGKLKNNIVYELFITDRSTQQLTAIDIIDLYYGRGGFEQTLSEEDREQNPDRWCSGQGLGQEFWQLLSQSVWNLRLRLGLVANPQEVRRTLWADAITINPTPTEQTLAPIVSPPSQPLNQTQQVDNALEPKPLMQLLLPEIKDNQASAIITEHCSNASAPFQKEIAAGEIKMAQPASQALSKFSGKDFHLQDNGTMKCPADKMLLPGERRKEANLTRIVYQAKASDCIACHLASACLISKSPTKGRRVSILLPLPIQTTALTQSSPLDKDQNTPLINNNNNNNNSIVNQSNLSILPIGDKPVFWHDLPATNLRRFLPDLLRLQHIDIKPAHVITPSSEKPRIFSRAMRAHRRLTWAQRLKRNAAPKYDCPWQFHLYGLPPEIAIYIKEIRSLAA